MPRIALSLRPCTTNGHIFHLLPWFRTYPICGAYTILHGRPCPWTMKQCCGSTTYEWFFCRFGSLLLDIFGRPVSWLKFSSSGLPFFVPHFWMRLILDSVLLDPLPCHFLRVSSSISHCFPLPFWLCHMKSWGGVGI